ncbi:glutathione S-transferase [Laetiporus sulphureus 93-53]|uniref:Glutathione S-transferase n=1 Tax=Laetiporus sulphureus 93-53 TaxID=1314785 RepID=A0A165GLG8_9APHY|nr:glutathione S-transferase [Laetiporus sulphureus 93-53]KZT10516.1 glutathione S-transferase [Laetiporus sulphureus 93-53]
MSKTSDSGKSYHRQCSGEALETANAHRSSKDITLFGSCFCPFVERVWTALEYLGIDYKYYEVDPYKKPADLLEVSPKGLVPALRLETYEPARAVNESTVILDFLEDLAANATKRSLLPPISDPYARALVRLQADHVNRTLVPSFYRYLQAQTEEKQIAAGREFVQAIEGLIKLYQRAEKETSTTCGLWREQGELSLADVMVAPWLFRATNVLPYYRGFALPEGPQFRAYIERIINYPAFKRTCSTKELYIDSYERYAYNRPNTSQVANAINSGSALP